MPHKMVITRSKGNSPPEDVITLRDAAVSLDEKKGYITIGVAGKTSVWRGLTTEDTFKWHDALLSALSQCAPITPARRCDVYSASDWPACRPRRSQMTKLCAQCCGACNRAASPHMHGMV